MILRLDNAVRPYAWGSTEAIPSFLGREQSDGPQAELWIGAHPVAPSRVVGGRTLGQAIAEDPVAALGAAAAARFGELPFLMKVLAAAQPLSIQAHPTEEQARAGFADEERRGVPLDAPTRNYKDPHHKPEMILAVSPFAALSGFRSPAEAARDIAELADGAPEAAPLLGAVSAPDPADALRSALRWLLSGGPEVRGLIAALAAGARARAGAPAGSQLPEPGAAGTVAYLDAFHPGDAGIGVALLLNRVDLRPGEALYLGAGNIHAYLRGLGIEVMAASDNVLRGGLTVKHVDVAELERIARFRVLRAHRVAPRTEGTPRARVDWYEPPAPEFRLAHVRLAAGASWCAPPGGPVAVLVVDGRVEASGGWGRRLALGRGDSAFVGADEAGAALRADGGPAELYATAVARDQR